MRSVKPFLPKTQNFPIRDNCPDLAKLPPPVQDLADLLAVIAAKRLKKLYPAAPREQEKSHD